MYTIDASVYVNANDPREIGYDKSMQLLQHLHVHTIPITVPTLVITEVSAAIARARGDITLAYNLAQQFSKLPNITFISLSLSLAIASAKIAADYRLRGADAIYVAVALDAQTTLITLDQEQLKRVSNLIRACSPTEALADLIGNGHS